MKRKKYILKVLVSIGIVTSITLVSYSANFKAKAVSEKPVAENNIVNNQVFNSMREKWKNDLTGGNEINLKDKSIKNNVDAIEKQCKNIYSKLNKSSDRKFLWKFDENYKEDPSKITDMYKKVLVMARAYNIIGGTYYNNKDLKESILSCLNWINKNAYNENIKPYKNWWHWWIGAPQTLGSIITLMYNDLTQTQIKSYMANFNKIINDKDVTKSKHMNGANLADIEFTELLQGINENDSYKVQRACKRIVPDFNYAEKNPNGFYKDGSFIQHEVVPYTGSYGAVFLTKTTNFLYITSNSNYKISSPNKDNIYKWIFKSFEPVIYNGYVMSNVRGRSISRANDQGFAIGSQIVEAIVKLSKIAPKEDSYKMKSLVKTWYDKSKYDFTKNFTSFKMIDDFNNIINNKNIPQLKEKAEDFSFNCMDRNVHKRKGYTFSIARSSNRIGKYEAMLGENTMPWYQGDGMTYIYDNDYKSYSNNFWPTIDPYKLPGTTVEDKKLKPILSNFGEYGLGTNTWSGSTNLDSYGVAGMQIGNKDNRLIGNKSWFMFDNEIVCLGSNISSVDKYDVQTIIQNKVINSLGSNQLVVDGKEQSSKLGTKSILENPKWAYVQGNNKGAGLGYYFPEGGKLCIDRQAREGRWSEINHSTSKSISKALVKNNFITMWFDHGVSPKKSQYAYVIIPNATKVITENYAQKPDIQILKNDSSIQAVKNNKLNIECANFFTSGYNKLGNITVKGKASIIIKNDKDGTLKIAVSDPTFIEKSIRVSINDNGYKLIRKDKNIRNVSLDKYIKFNVNTENSKGKSYEIILKQYSKKNSNLKKQGWNKENNNWYYLDDNGVKQTGWIKTNNKWYYLNNKGIMQIGWVSVNNQWYYLNNSGAMQIGWIYLNNKWYYLNSNGSMKIGWIKTNNKWYYLNNKGELV